MKRTFILLLALFAALGLFSCANSADGGTSGGGAGTSSGSSRALSLVGRTYVIDEDDEASGIYFLDENQWVGIDFPFAGTYSVLGNTIAGSISFFDEDKQSHTYKYTGTVSDQSITIDTGKSSLHASLFNGTDGSIEGTWLGNNNINGESYEMLAILKSEKWAVSVYNTKTHELFFYDNGTYTENDTSVTLSKKEVSALGKVSTTDGWQTGVLSDFKAQGEGDVITPAFNDVSVEKVQPPSDYGTIPSAEAMKGKILYTIHGFESDTIKDGISHSYFVFGNTITNGSIDVVQYHYDYDKNGKKAHDDGIENHKDSGTYKNGTLECQDGYLVQIVLYEDKFYKIHPYEEQYSEFYSATKLPEYKDLE